MNAPAFDRYLRYDELTQLLKQFEREFNVAHLESIGTSHEGREVWALTISGPGEALEKPGFLVDANIHGSEVTASMAALHFAWTVLSKYGTDETITRLVDTTALYVIPMISPDGVEHVLSGAGWVRSGTRMYPHEEMRPGLHMSDIDGNGEMLSMRMEDPGGGWKISQKDPRLLVPRPARGSTSTEIPVPTGSRRRCNPGRVTSPCLNQRRGLWRPLSRRDRISVVCSRCTRGWSRSFGRLQHRQTSRCHRKISLNCS